MQYEKIQKIQGLRAIAFLMVFIGHSQFHKVEAFGVCGVSIFLLLSGMLLTYNSLNRKITPQHGICGVWGHIKKLYPLHIVMLFFAIIYELYVIHVSSNGSVASLTVRSGLDVLLIQAWVPCITWVGGLNGPSWYLCVACFCYLMFPVIFEKISKVRYKYSPTVLILGFVILQIIIAFFAGKYGRPLENDWFSTKWITYFCPITRLIDFCIGCCVGVCCYNHNTDDTEPTKAGGIARSTIYEVVSITIMFFAIFLYVNDYVGDGYKYASLFSIPSALLIATISTQRGYVSRLLSLKPLTFLGDLSAYMFLIHFVVIKYSYALLQKIFGVGFNKSIIVFVAFFLTICTAIMWKWLMKRIKNWKPLV